jgi:hypothetical protein
MHPAATVVLQGRTGTPVVQAQNVLGAAFDLHGIENDERDSAMGTRGTEPFGIRMLHGDPEAATTRVLAGAGVAAKPLHGDRAQLDMRGLRSLMERRLDWDEAGDL